MSTCSVAAQISLAKDVVLTLGAIVGAVVAIVGLRTWNRQLKGQTEYELTRRLLKHTYRLREAIKDVRYPVMLVPKEASTGTDGQELSQEQQRHVGLAKAYHLRWEKVTEARSDIQAELLEAEALWTPDAHVHFESLFGLADELLVEVRSFLTLSDPSISNETKDALHMVQTKKRSVMYDALGSAPDPYADDLARVIAQIEAYLKPHLKK